MAHGVVVTLVEYYTPSMGANYPVVVPRVSLVQVPLVSLWPYSSY